MENEVKVSVVEVVGGKKHMYDDSDLIPRQAVLDIIKRESELEGSPFDELPFFLALKVWLFCIFHPIQNSRIAIRGTKKNIYDAVVSYKSRD